MKNSTSDIPRRSILYIPASNKRALEKINSLDADGYIIDLEDAVAPEEKETARELMKTVLDGNSYKNREIIIRINGLDTKWGNEDLKAGCMLNPDAILVPKVEKNDTIGNINELINDAGATQDTMIWAMIETPRGVLNAKKIAKSTKRLSCLVMGTTDLTNDLRAQHTPDRLALLYSLSHVILAARAAGKSVIDGVHLDLNDEDEFRTVCTQGKELGFDGKSLIHPKQIAFANETFGPTEKDVELAQAVITAFDDAISKGKGVAVLDGKLIESLHVENAKRVLNMAKIIASR